MAGISGKQAFPDALTDAITRAVETRSVALQCFRRVLIRFPTLYGCEFGFCSLNLLIR
jgi:hypothetical protein